MATDKRTIKFEITADADARGIDKFRSALSAFSQEAPIAEKTLKQVRDAMIEFSKTAEPTSKSINSQIRAFETLRSEVKLGSPLWRQLGNDIADAKGKIGLLTGGLGKAADAQERLNKLIDSPILKLNTFGKLAEHAGKLKAELTGLSYRSEEYLRTLTRIRELETVGSFNQGRLNAIANNRAFMGGTLARGSGSSEMMAALPDTLAGDAQRVSELTERIRNLDRGSELYLQTVKELTVAQRQQAAAQEQLNRAMAVADGSIARRRSEGAAAANLSLAERAAVERERRRQFTSAAELERWQQAGRDRVGQIRGDFDLGAAAASQRERRRQFEQGRAAREAAAETALWQDAGRQRVSQLRYGDDLAARARAERDRARAAADQRRADAEQAAALRNQKLRETRRRELREFGQSATAVGVAGYFGGPEAVLGAGIGSLFGPGGAAVGTTAGLAVGGLRAQVAGFSGQAAELDKMRIALKANTTSAQEYARSLNIIENANKQLNIPLQEGTRGFTQLLAAVKGAGGTINDAEIAYRAINSAIKANGGSTQDAEGAMRALVQTFSKGKVSAEELRGQLAERLPGAVTLFAKSLGMTGPELDKALEQGKVGLGDLMKFLVELEKRNYSTAERIAASQAEAGIRLQNQWNAVALEIGRAFAPVGAEIQDTLSKFLKQNGDDIARWAKATAEAISVAIRAVDSLGVAIQNLQGIQSRLRPLLNLNPGFALMDMFGYKDAANQAGVLSPNAFLKQAGGGALNRDQLASMAAEVDATLKELRQKRANVFIPFLTREDEALDAQIKTLVDRRSAITARIKTAPGATGPLTPSGLLRNNPAEDKSGESAARKAEAEAERQRRIAEQLAAERQRLLEANAQQEIRLADMVYRHKTELDNRRAQNQRTLADLNARAEITGLPAGRRETAQRFVELRQFFGDQQERIRVLQTEKQAAELNLSNAQKMAAITAVIPSVSAGATIGGSAIRGGAMTRRTRDRDAEATGWDIVMPGGRGAAVQAPLALTITGTGFQGSGAGSGGRGYGNWVSGEFELGGKKYELLLGHFDRIDVAKGMQVPQGARLGTQGITGRTFGTHVTTHVNPKSGASVADAWGALEAVTRIWERGASGGGLRRSPAGVPAQQVRNVGDVGDVAMAQLGVGQANQNLLLEQQFQSGERAARIKQFLNEGTQALNDNTQSIRDNIEQLQQRTRLTLEGFKPEEIEGIMRLTEASRENLRVMDQLNADLADAQRSGNPDLIAAATANIQRQGNAFRANAEAIREQTKAQVEANKALEQFAAKKSLIQGIGSTLFNGINSAITAIVSGTKEWGQALKEIASNILADIGQQLVSFGLRSLLGGISFGGIPLFGGAFADGGRPPLGKVSVVGERGPELFVPDTAGTIVPNHKLAASLAPSQPTVPAGPIEVNLQTQVINGVEYATVDQVKVAMRQAAERGQSMALNRLQRSTRTRKKVGV